MVEKREGDRHQDKAPEPAKAPFMHYEVRENGTVHAYSTEAGNRMEAWFQGGTGAFRIINNDGSMSEHFPGDSRVEYEGMTMTISNNLDQHIGGHLSVKTKGGAEVQITGDGQITIGGAALINILGDAGISVKGNAKIMSGGGMDLDAAGSMNIKTGGGLNIGAAGGITVQGASVDINPGGAKSGYDSA